MNNSSFCLFRGTSLEATRIASTEDNTSYNNNVVDEQFAATYNGDVEYYVACYAYQSAEAGDLVFDAGEIVAVTKKEGDWWTGNIGNRTGIFPSNYVQKQETVSTAIETGSEPSVIEPEKQVIMCVKRYFERLVLTCLCPVISRKTSTAINSSRSPSRRRRRIANNRHRTQKTLEIRPKPTRKYRKSILNLRQHPPQTKRTSATRRCLRPLPAWGKRAKSHKSLLRTRLPARNSCRWRVVNSSWLGRRLTRAGGKVNCR